MSYQSKLQPEYSVSATENSSVGFYLHLTDSDEEMTPFELFEHGATEETINSLREKGYYFFYPHN